MTRKWIGIFSFAILRINSMTVSRCNLWSDWNLWKFTVSLNFELSNSIISITLQNLLVEAASIVFLIATIIAKLVFSRDLETVYDKISMCIVVGLLIAYVSILVNRAVEWESSDFRFCLIFIKAVNVYLTFLCINILSFDNVWNLR